MIAPTTRHLTLPAGDLTVTVASGTHALDDLCDFAVRNNARRGFLIVSRVLGRHLPATPAAMQASFDHLARTIPAALPGPIVFIGMAETAIALGQGVHAAHAAQTGRTDTLYLHTTRQQIDARRIATFEEPHSHASAHLVYAPADPAHQALLAAARSLIIVDDEASTGTTVTNLAAAIRPAMPRMEHLHAAVLADWSTTTPTIPITSLLKGQLHFTANAGITPSASPPPAAALGHMPIHKNFGRLGLQHYPHAIDPLLPPGAHGPPQRFLVLGTGEFVYPPFRLAARLAELGHHVEVQATTRSPIHIGGAIRSVIELTDNYATGVPNFIYNITPDPGRRVLICHETPPGSIDPAFQSLLGAECIHFGDPA